MDRTVTKVSKRHPAIKAILRATFPQYKGRTVMVVSGPSTVIGSPADGGTYRRARLLSFGTMGVTYVHNDRFELPISASDNFCIVTHDFYCGKDCGIAIYVGSALAADDLAVLVDALLQTNGAADIGNGDVASAMCHQMFAGTRTDLAVWGSYDKGHEHVRALDLAWVVAQETAELLRKGERRVEAA